MAERNVEKIGEILIRQQVITPEQADEALKEQRATGRFLGEILVDRGMVTETALTKLSDAGVVSPDDAEILIPAARLYFTLTQVLRLCLDKPFVAADAPLALRELLARATETPDFDVFWNPYLPSEPYGTIQFTTDSDDSDAATGEASGSTVGDFAEDRGYFEEPVPQSGAEESGGGAAVPLTPPAQIWLTLSNATSAGTFQDRTDNPA